MFRVVKDPLVVYRFARLCSLRRVPLLPQLCDYWIRWWFSCWLPHTADIGRGCKLGYGGLGCVVHASAVIGERVRIGSNCVVGGNGITNGVPVIEDDVYIGFGAAVLGPVRIGKGSVIGANAVVVNNVPAYSVVVGVPGRVVKHIQQDSQTHGNRT
jgi:serine O-acetyltransferase